MTAAPARLPAIRRPPARVDHRLAVLLADLHHLGLHARVLMDATADDPDVRLCAWADDRQTCVELLWCCPQAPPPAQPMAVRIVGDQRAVWRNTGALCRPAAIVRFLCDLILLDEDALAHHYIMVG